MATAAEASKEVKQVAKKKEKEEEERKKARMKKMTLEQYRAWRDREMWANAFNALRKKKFLHQPLTSVEELEMQEMEKKLAASGGVPPPSKTMLQAKNGSDTQ